MCVGVFFANSSAKLNIPQPGDQLTTCSSSIEHVTVLCGFSLTPSFGRIRSIRTSLRDGGTAARPHHVHHPASWFPLGSRLSLLSRRAALLCQASQKDQAGRVAWQVLTRGTPLNHSCDRVAKLALERRRVQQRCPRGFSSAALGHRPQNRTKGADPRTGTPQSRKVFLPWYPVSSLSWPACAVSFLVPGRWFSGPAPSVSCLFCSA